MRLSLVEVPHTASRVRLNCLQCFVPVRPGAVRLITGLWADKSSKFVVTSRRASALLDTVDRHVLGRPVLVPDGTPRGVPTDVWLRSTFPVDDPPGEAEASDGEGALPCLWAALPWWSCARGRSVRSSS